MTIGVDLTRSIVFDHRLIQMNPLRWTDDDAGNAILSSERRQPAKLGNLQRPHKPAVPELQLV
jgi:hypothetical protein